jgi:hypothetical protein
VTARLIARCKKSIRYEKFLEFQTRVTSAFLTGFDTDGLAVCDFTPRVDEKQISIQKLPDDEVP